MSAVWTYNQINSPELLNSLIPQAADLRGKVIIEFSDGKLEVGIRLAFLNLFWFQILSDFNLPICKRHFIYRNDFNKSVLMSELTKYYDEIEALGIHGSEKKLKASLWTMETRLYITACTELLPFVSSLDIMDMAEIMTDPVMKEVLDTKKTIDISIMGSDAVEKIIDVNNKRMMELFGTKNALVNEALYPYQCIGQLNKFQVPQTMYAFGPRTDVNDTIIGLPVIGSALDGVRNVQEYAVESLSAKKSAFYNKLAVASSQYFGRQQHLLAMAIEYIYPGDCGSTKLVDFDVTEKNYKGTIGKNIMVDGRMVQIDESNAKSFINTTIHMRSPMTCKCTNGVCEVCGGKLMNNINRKLLLGVLSAIQVIEPCTQKILSAKHLIRTLSLIYTLSKKAGEVLFPATNNVMRWNSLVTNKIGKYWMGVEINDFPKFHDVVNLTVRGGSKQFKEERFSKITKFYLKDANGNIDSYPLQDGDNIPFLTSDMLMHLRTHYNDKIIDDGVLWFPLVGTEKLQIFKTVVTNDNMLQFVKNVRDFLNTTIEKETSCSEALYDFSKILYNKVDINIAHVEILLKAYLIASKNSYKVPVVADPEHVTFGKTATILTRRAVGVECAFQGLLKYTTTPTTYLVAKQPSPMDLMIGYPDYR